MPQLFVGGLAWSVNNQRLWELFAAFGGLNAVGVRADSVTSRSLGFGFISIGKSGASAAIDVLDSAEIDGRIIQVSLERPIRKRDLIWEELCDLEKRLVRSSPEPVVEMAREIGKILVAAVQNDFTRIDDLHHRNFELLVAELLRNAGYDVTITPPSRDGGYDLLITQTDAIGITSVWAVECKHYAPGNPVGVELVEKLFGVVKVRLDGAKPMLVTSSTFTAGALNVRLSTHNVELNARDRIRAWIGSYQHNANGKILIALR